MLPSPVLRKLSISELIGFVALTTFFIIAILIILTTWMRKRKLSKANEDEATSRGAISKSRDASPPLALGRPRSHSWRTPPQSRKEYLAGPSTLGDACRKGAPLFDPVQMENILKNYTKSLPSYRSRLESIEDEGSRSEDDEAPGRYEGPGKISLRMAYNGEVLLVHVLNCKGLPAHCLWTSRGPQYFRRNPYVNVSLVPESNSDSESFETKARHRTLNPKFDEAFEFALAPQDLHEKALKIVVFDREEGRSPKMVGMVMQPLDVVSPEREENLVLDLSRSERPGKEEPESMQRRGSSPGDIFVGLTCNPLTNRIRINVLKMKGFRTPRDIRLSGAYVRVQLYHGHHLLKTKTTSAQRIPRDANDEVSIFESFNFGIPGKFFDSCSLSLTIVAAIIPKDNAPARDLILGNIILGAS
ncbi:synaptotagmin 2 [Galendromus occidentalis]|uniref:Synaptotagmin 2 n=1 Tax=Galendromus occidentalis TaxID=34638 RepID=A0AAJ6QSQ7_9ACAR|nr:synaptotagmin 2 [Galendromus occidentalis]